MQDAVRRHDGLMRTAIAAHDGYVFKTIGDAFCAAFARPEEAVAAILDAQRALASEDFSAVDGLRVRAAIHTGTTDERDGDYFGSTVNRVARLLVIGHGGQVLVSGATGHVVQGDLPPRVGLRDLGEHRLTDLARPEQVYQLLAPGLAAEFPPLRSLDVLPSNLPVQLTTFVGRGAELEEIAALVRDHRLVTLIGSGGVGKTQTALQVATALGDPGAVWFVGLARINEPSLVPAAIASALRVQQVPNRPLLETLLEYLKNKTVLLILDNCEHVVTEAATAAHALLAACPRVRILATSREPLKVAGERTFRLPSLSSPSPEAAPGLDVADAAAYEAIVLFCDRARAVDHHFTLTDENAPIVGAVCGRLDGIALAIELAAARVNVLSVKALAEKLDDRFRVLTGGERAALPRQQTMRATIDWSYDLLAAPEQRLFERLSVFAGGCTLVMATAVCGGELAAEGEMLNLLSSLVDKSLVAVDLESSEPRYRLLESFRQYAREKLAARGERGFVAHQHALASLALAEQCDRAYRALAQEEMDNWRRSKSGSATEGMIRRRLEEKERMRNIALSVL
jgi:predicted ATPase